ncbi:MAG: copper resistance protein CopB [Gemmatimonas sp.]|uniref:copper resistance protein B n=1 Tax=Gemmatimonas sp. UBA7669 TaxID=1946568 RepID=UPI0025C2A97A|nr:copper resistance protein B [Gemmatimonas sp. UBA7669]MBA3917581.1 copper resistance protein CopB [Gemmatimonas sp.]
MTGPFPRARAGWRQAVVFSLASLLSVRADAQLGEGSHRMDLDRVIRTFILAEQLEVHANQPARPVDVELVSWIGGDYRRMFLRLQGEQSTRVSGGGEFQVDVLYGRLITPFWSVVAGARVDSRVRNDVVLVDVGNPSSDRPGARSRLTRGMLAIGVVGLAPGWFEVEPILLVSDKGDVSFEVQSSFDVLVTQRLIVQPWVEISAAAQAVRQIGVNSGLNDVEVGARMRYEIRRKFAPYVGVSVLRRTGIGAPTTHNLGERRRVGTIMAGLRIWR